MHETAIPITVADTPKLEEVSTPPPAIAFQKEIGKTVYDVSAYFSETSHEDICDKITRLIKNDFEKGEIFNAKN